MWGLRSWHRPHQPPGGHDGEDRMAEGGHLQGDQAAAPGCPCTSLPFRLRGVGLEPGPLYPTRGRSWASAGSGCLSQLCMRLEQVELHLQPQSPHGGAPVGPWGQRWRTPGLPSHSPGRPQRGVPAFTVLQPEGPLAVLKERAEQISVSLTGRAGSRFILLGFSSLLSSARASGWSSRSTSCSRSRAWRVLFGGEGWKG